MSNKRGAVLLAGVLVAGATAAWVLRDVPPTRAPSAPAARPVATERATPPAPPPPREAERPSTPPPAATAAGAPPGCPGEDVEDPSGFVRPSTWDLFVLRTMELRDRLPHFTSNASPPLREGLTHLNDPEPELDGLFDAPDRWQDGFDVAMAALLHVATRHLARRELAPAHRLAVLAGRRAPDDPLTHVLSATVANRHHRTSEALAAYRRAASLLPDEPALLLALARAADTAGEFAAARDAGARYLALEPDDVRLRSWQVRMSARADTIEPFLERNGTGIRVHYPSGIERGRVERLISTARAAMDDTARLLHRDRRPELTVVVYPDVDGMRAATCAPTWSGGVYDGVLHLAARTVERSALHTIRHEATHAQLALVRGPIPHWFNEGLAQHMEGAPRPGAYAAWARMVERRFWIPFASLEGQLVVIEDADDARLAYYQSLAMVRWLLDARGARTLRFAADHIEARQHQDLMEQLLPGADGDAMLRYLAGVLASRPHVPTAEETALPR